MKILHTLIRVYGEQDELDTTIRFYESLYDQNCSNRFSYDEKELELAVVAHTLIIAGTPEARKPFEATRATFLVTDIHEIKDRLLAEGSKVLEMPQKVPTGWNMLVEHPDGIRVEYVEHIIADVQKVNKVY
ncbi:hypothetical protein H8B09_16425 [Paenibacillus sp. PR3]|uniref:Glyoxalase n=1 Tax=Paenibacillus terricola TaxID=2763503 RepID=A0ABR8MWK2_9BACL|nr:hypothetical protein [Paenibacillus terricola]MBD3920349.1 hypothetical protein [Paenibacillus terricola]